MLSMQRARRRRGRGRERYRGKGRGLFALEGNYIYFCSVAGFWGGYDAYEAHELCAMMNPQLYISLLLFFAALVCASVTSSLQLPVLGCRSAFQWESEV